MSVIIPAPEARRQVLVTAAVYRTVTVPATEDVPAHDVQELVSPAVFRDQTDDEFYAWVASIDVPVGTAFSIISIEDFPLELDPNGAPVLDKFGVVKHDRTFRAAWEFSA